MVRYSISVTLAVQLVLAGLSMAAFPDCTKAPLASNTVCNAKASYLDRATALVSLMTTEEMINNTVNGSPGIPRLGLPPYQWWSEALHGVAYSPGVNFASSGDFSSATSFPMPILLGAAFDDPLINQVATVVSTEARAFNNYGRAGLDFWTPNINPFRDPRWGRGQETPGEDPFHLKSYVYQLITGLQGGIDPKYKRVVADCKHYAAYDMENSDGTDRYSFNAKVALQDLVSYYLPSFETCVRDAHVGSVICSYNAVNGVPSCANTYLLQTILRDTWGFDTYNGWVTSDCDAISNIYNNHHWSPTAQEAVAGALRAGTDLDCGTFYSKNLPSAFNQSLITNADLQKALINQYSSLIQLGYFDPASSQPYRSLGWSDVNTASSQALALTAAREGIVLLKNDGTLPLSSSIKKLALIGPWANATTQMQGNYNGRAPFLISPEQGATKAGYTVTFEYGTAINSGSTSGFAAAISAAKAADAIIYLGGIDESIESEGNDRTGIAWPGNQLELISQLGLLGKKFIVVQMGGGQVDDTELKANSSVNALLWAGYPGQSGGQAIFDIISGKVPPAGRLPVTQYPASYANQMRMTDMNLRPGTNNPGRTYMWYTDTPVYSFGFGMHYTTFNYAWQGTPPTSFHISKLLSNAPALNTNRTDTAPLATYSIAVTNTGKVTSDHVVLLFAKASGNGQSIQQLVAYTRLHGIAPGATQVAHLNLTLASLMTVDTNGNKWLNAGTYTLMADVNARLKLTVTLTGKNAQLQQWPTDPTTVAAPLDTSKQYHLIANGRQGCYRSGRQRFQFTPVKGKTNMYTISVPRGRSGCNTFIGASDCTAFSCTGVAGDDESGRQEWFVQPVPGQQGVYTVQVAGGRDTCGKYMGVASCSASDPNLVSIHSSNDASGHQEWVFSAV
ncbi:hypothetical protein BZG36_03104 [Bifiguratus adelaidae]|uniref:xylan 1,4-beta-xylosidase n=1 Tax=Bifiguratus adelaidae TaxID=1938954 RepID=A0A261XYV9_9FUNG|nr:hypothetical protein BZG36_03104 [Bifiguratus adelaidae]